MVYAYIAISEEEDHKAVYVAMYNDRGEKIDERTIKCKVLEINGVIRIARISPKLIIMAELSKGEIRSNEGIAILG